MLPTLGFGGMWVDQAAGGAGDVTGPAQSLDRQVVVFDGTTGKAITDAAEAIFDGGLLEFTDAAAGPTVTQTDRATGNADDLTLRAQRTLGGGGDGGDTVLAGAIGDGAGRTGGVRVAAPAGAATQTYLELEAGDAAPVSIAGNMSLVYDSATDTARISTNTTAYRDVLAKTAAGLVAISIPDNTATALRVHESANDYIVCDTTDGAEKIAFGKAIELNTSAGTPASSGDIRVRDTFTMKARSGGSDRTLLTYSSVGDQFQLGEEAAGGGPAAVSIEATDHVELSTRGSGTQRPRFRVLDFSADNGTIAEVVGYSATSVLRFFAGLGAPSACVFQGADGRTGTIDTGAKLTIVGGAGGNGGNSDGGDLELFGGPPNGTGDGGNVSIEAPTGTVSGQTRIFQAGTARITVDGAGEVILSGDTLNTFTTPPVLPSYTVAGVPSASPAAQMIYVTDETGGAVPAFSDGADWRRVTDRAVIGT